MAIKKEWFFFPRFGHWKSQPRRPGPLLASDPLDFECVEMKSSPCFIAMRGK